MPHVTRNNFPLVFIIFLMMPMSAHAIPAITCHCFTDRSYEPARPAAADPYFLATTQNTFFSIVFSTDKKVIVMKKQQGTSPDDLWIAYWIALKTGVSPETLLKAKHKTEAWNDVVASLRLRTKDLGTRFSLALDARFSSAHLAEAVVDDLFHRYQLLSDKELAAMRQVGASNQELIISTVIAAKTRQSAKQIYLEVKNGSKTWGSLFTWINIDTKNMQQEISNILKLQPQ